MEWYYAVAYFTLGYAWYGLALLIRKARTEVQWECPHCSLKITTNQKDFMIQYKTDHLASHILR